MRNRIPADILEDDALNRAIGRLPANYNFEIHKTVWRVREVCVMCDGSLVCREVGVLIRGQPTYLVRVA